MPVIYIQYGIKMKLMKLSWNQLFSFTRNNYEDGERNGVENEGIKKEFDGYQKMN